MGRQEDEDVRGGSRRSSRSRSRDRGRSDHRKHESVISRSRRRSRSQERSTGRSDHRSRASRSRSGSPVASTAAKERRSKRRSNSEDRKPSHRRSRSRSASHSRSRSRRHCHRHRSRSSSVSESDSESSSSDEDSSSSSDSDDDHGRSKSKRSHKKNKKAHKMDDRKKKKSKKDKKKKKKKSASHAVNQNAYGKYGILRESDFHTKSQSFQAWLRDIKGVTEFNGPKWEAMEMFKEYMEDFNTATMPHEKYYDIEKYEMRQYAKQQQKRAKHQLTAMGVALPDEAAYQRERQAQRAAREQEDFKLVLQTMDKDKIEGMRRQEQLRAQMQMQYKAGNVAEARRLEQLLKADEEDKRWK